MLRAQALASSSRPAARILALFAQPDRHLSHSPASPLPLPSERRRTNLSPLSARACSLQEPQFGLAPSARVGFPASSPTFDRYRVRSSSYRSSSSIKSSRSRSRPRLRHSIVESEPPLDFGLLPPSVSSSSAPAVVARSEKRTEKKLRKQTNSIITPALWAQFLASVEVAPGSPVHDLLSDLHCAYLLGSRFCSFEPPLTPLQPLQSPRPSMRPSPFTARP